MGRFGWIVAAALALVGFYVGRSLGPAPVAFPDPGVGRSAEEMESEVARALREPRAFPRASALIRLFESLTPENAPGAARAVSSRAAEYDPVDLQLFLTAWTHLDAPSAMREVQSWPIRSRRELGTRIVMREWAASGQTLEAGNFFDTLTDPDQRNVAAAPLVRGWALSGDTAGALALAQRFWEQEERRDVVDALIRGALHSQGPKGVIELARRVDPTNGGPFARSVAHTALSLAAREDAEAAAAYYDTLVPANPPPWLAGELVRIAGLLRNTRPERALEWLMPKPAGPERTQALMETTGTWAKRDFEAAWAWFEAHREPTAAEGGGELSETDSALLTGLVRRMARIRPEAASSWAPRIRSASDRVEMLRRVAYFWSARDARAADAWIAGLALPDAERARLLEAAEWGRTRKPATAVDAGDAP